MMSNIINTKDAGFYYLMFALIFWLGCVIRAILNKEVRHEWQIKQVGNKFTAQKKIIKRWGFLNETIDYSRFDTLEGADLFIEEKKHIPLIKIHKR